MFIQIKNGEPTGFPVTDENLRMLVPNNVSLPRYPMTVDVLPLGFAVYEFAQVPDPAASEFKVVEEGTPIWTNDDIRGDYVTQVWNVRDMTADEIVTAIEQQWTSIRADRNARLAACDWTQLADAPVDAADWMGYRQDLRDVTTQADPFNIAWPAAPGA